MEDISNSHNKIIYKLNLISYFMKLKSFDFLLAGILVIVLAMPFGVFPCQFSNLSECAFGNGLIASVLGYLLILIGIFKWLKENCCKR